MAVEPSRQTVWDHHPELRAMQAAFDQVIASRQGRVVLVAAGPAGGRTGLVRALATRLSDDPARPAVVAGGFRGDQWEPWPLAGTVRRDALQAGMDLAIKVLELGDMLGVPAVGAVARLLGQLAGTSRAAWALLSRHVQDNQPLPGGSGPGAVREVLRVAAGPQPVVGWQPVVCVLDDLDRASAAQEWWQGLVVRLAGELRDLPLLLVVTLDGPAELDGHELGEPTGLWAARRLVEAGVGAWLPVGRLDVAAVTRWLWPCEPGLAERLWEVTGGEPTWLGELWEHWQATRAVHRDLPGQWVLSAPDREALGKVHDLLWERIERCYGARLSNDDQLGQIIYALAVGALEGREFTAQAVALVVSRDADELIDEFDEHLLISPEQPDGVLQEAGFVELDDPRATAGGDETEVVAVCRYRFASELHWRTLRRYGLLGHERKDGCQTMAAALQQVLQPEPERAAMQIASLLRQAGDHQAAASWQIQAELGGAVPLVEARARLLLAQDTSGWDRFDHAQAAQQLGHAARLLSLHRPTGSALEVARGWARAAQAAGWHGEHARALRACAMLHERQGEQDTAIEYYRTARHAARAAGDLTLAAHAMADRARIDEAQGRVRVARRRAEVARQVAHHHRAFAAEGHALQTLSFLAARDGDWEGVLAAVSAGTVAAERADDRRLLALMLALLSEAQERVGQVEQSRVTALRSLKEAREAGDRYHEGWSELRLGKVWAAEDSAAAQRHLLHGLAIARQLDDRILKMHCRIELARVACDLEETRAARAELGQATRLVFALSRSGLETALWDSWTRLAQAQDVPGAQVALLCAVTALHAERDGDLVASSWWEGAEQEAAAVGEPADRAGLAARAQAALAHDGGWELLQEVFGPLDADGSDVGDHAGSGD